MIIDFKRSPKYRKNIRKQKNRNVEIEITQQALKETINAIVRLMKSSQITRKTKYA